jgi:tartrate dehydratase beta subunit/fumarate hydratase class I family protein
MPNYVIHEKRTVDVSQQLQPGDNLSLDGTIYRIDSIKFTIVQVHETGDFMPVAEITPPK